MTTAPGSDTRPTVSLEEFVDEARHWLDHHAEHRSDPTRSGRDGTDDVHHRDGEFSVAVFHSLTEDEERALLDRLCTWTQLEATRGYHAITASPDEGGLGLPGSYARAFAKLEQAYQTPASHETHSVTTRLIAPTVRIFGSPAQRERHVADFLAARSLCCQLFSEPGAGSDLATLACRAVRDGDEWVVNGQKVWSSGAQFSQWGELIARTDPSLPKHRGLTAFLIPMDLPGIEVRPIRQMSGGTSFNEVFFTDVRVPDTMRLGPENDGWKVALTTLGFERDHSGGSSGQVGGSWRQLLATARATGANDHPVVRQQLARRWTNHRIEGFVNRRAADLRRAGVPPGPEGSLGKLLWTEGMTHTSDVVSQVLGAALVAGTDERGTGERGTDERGTDERATGEWGTYAWGEHVLGAPGYRIAGGSDEVQRNIIGERVLGLPAEPRLDKDIAWRDIPR